jgi:tetratricopeptide (TPR) repeat protein
MKSNSTIHTATSAERGQQILSRFLAVDELLIRPGADQIQDPFVNADDQPKSPVRISLARHQELEQCLRNSPADPAPYLELAEIYSSQQRWKDVRRILDQGVNHNPDNESMRFMREEILMQCSREQLDLAKKELRSRRTEENELEVERCETDLANTRVAVCEARYKRHPDQSDLLIPWAIALRQLRRMDEAIEQLRKAQQVPELRSRASLQLGMCYQQTGGVLDALAAYRCAALFRAPTPPDDLKQRALELAYELAEQNQLYDSAVRYLELLLAEQPKNRDFLENRMKALRQHIPT